MKNMSLVWLLILSFSSLVSAVSASTFKITPLQPIKILKKPSIGLLTIDFFNEDKLESKTFTLGDCPKCVRGAAIKNFVGFRIEGESLHQLTVSHKASSGIPVHECSKNELNLYQTYSCKFKTENKEYQVILKVEKAGHPEQSKIIYIDAEGPTPELTKEFNQQFFKLANQKSCWSSGDMNKGKNIFGNLCVKFLPYTGEKLTRNDNWYKQDYRLKITFDKKQYSKHFFCSDGTKDYSCINPGRFDIPENAKIPNYIISTLLNSPTTLGAK